MSVGNEEYCSGYHPDGVNLIVLGDSPAEIQAGQVENHAASCSRSGQVSHLQLSLCAGSQISNEGAVWQVRTSTALFERFLSKVCHAFCFSEDTVRSMVKTVKFKEALHLQPWNLFEQFFCTRWADSSNGGPYCE